MGLAGLRDLVLIIYGLLAIGLTISLIILIILLYRLYRKVGSLLDSLKRTAADIRQTSSTISENVIQPVAKLYGFISGIRRAVEVMETLRKDKDKGAKGGEK